MTENIHETLSRASSLYKDWHSGTHSTLFHFSLLIIFGTLFAKDIIFFPANINPEGQLASVAPIVTAKTLIEEESSFPEITSFRIKEIAAREVVIEWQTSRPSSGRLFWGEEIRSTDNQILSGDFSLSHTVQLADLEPNTPYFYKIEAFLDGPVVDFAIASFRTLSK